MCDKIEAVEARSHASAALLMACEQKFGLDVALKEAFPVDPDIPPELWRFLNKL